VLKFCLVEPVSLDEKWLTDGHRGQ
jgi:hypothetical protein